MLILDEPTSGLDPVMQENFIQFIHEEKERGKTILLSSHIFSEIDSTCDRIAIIKDGKIVSQFVADETLREDVIALCLCVVTVDGKISLRERNYIRKLCKA